MTKYEPQVTLNSQTEGFEEVSFIIRKFSHGLRSRVRQQLAPALSKIREKTERINELIEESSLDQPAAPVGIQLVIPLDDAGQPDQQPTPQRFTASQLAVIERISDINNEISIITAAEVDLVYLQEGLVSITGIEIEGKTPGAKLLYERGPEDLCQEIIAAIKEQAGLPSALKSNLGLPTTSGAVVDGQTSDTIAPDANAIAGMPLETAPDTSLTK
jgi:hypothetical protein